MNHHETDTFFVVIRIDTFQTSDEARFSIKEIVRTEREADAEVSRLNGLNRDRGARYLWQIGRLRP